MSSEFPFCPAGFSNLLHLMDDSGKHMTYVESTAQRVNFVTRERAQHQALTAIVFQTKFNPTKHTSIA